MSWISLLDNAQFLLSLYPDSVPSLEGAVLHEVKMHCEGPVVSLRFDVPDFPANPPAKWRTQRFNVAQVTVMGIGVRRLVQNGWSNDTSVSITFAAEDGGVRVRALGAGVEFEATFDDVRVDGVSAYLNSLNPTSSLPDG